MKTVDLIIVALILPIMGIFGQEASYDRKPAVAGSFYPSDPGKLKNELTSWFSSLNAPDKSVRVRAIIAPHAGYVYSGHTAAAAFAAVSNEAEYDNIFLIGCSHRYSYEGAAPYTGGNMLTPLGTVIVNRELGRELINDSRWFLDRDDVHMAEHSLEVQLPFIQFHLNRNIKVIPILLGTHNLTVLKGITESLKPYFNDRNLFIISSDFSHYPSYNDAVKTDRTTSDAIINGDPDKFVRSIKKSESEGTANLATAMCSWPAALVLLYLTSGNSDIVYRNLEYTNSGDSPYGDRESVVGYNAIVAEEKMNQAAGEAEDEFQLNADERKTLLSVARDAISTGLDAKRLSDSEPPGITANLRKPLGAFVTIIIDGSLRGCIGCFTSTDPLWMAVRNMAREAAFRDPRFMPLTRSEYPGIEIEISVLGPMKRITDINQIVIGRHGIYLKNGFHSGTLLPQVASERGWTRNEFLGYCSRDKAGLGWDGWKAKDTEIYIYEAYVFGEK